MHILIIRLGAMGDVILASGLISALRTLYPEARIDWLAESGNADLLCHHPELDHLHLWPRQHWRRLRQQGRHGQFLAEARTLVQTLREPRYDLVLDGQGLLKSGIWAWLSGGRRRIGLGSREGSQWLMTETLDRQIDSPLPGKEYRKLAMHLGAEARHFVPGVAVCAADMAEARRLLQECGLDTPAIMLAPFTTRPQKHWFAERWLALATALHQASKQPLILLGGPGDRDRAAQWTEHSAGALVNLAGQTRLGVAAALIRQARLLIGVDTGLTHLGMVSSIPVLALFGSTRPYLASTNPQGRVLYHPLSCSPCRRRPTCDGRFDCMALHEVNAVLAQALEMLA
ncbi:glycosyltransferase family 9 protein [Candidatus Woesearchaeota archaeon]|nr:glycosyltransferase family 9 protein [Candidatus Woesearchaeota archaeon]